MDEWSGRTKMPVPKLKSLVLDEDPNFCTLCNLDLSSDITALTHYQGENHAKNLRKLNAGTLDPNDRGFGIGLGFRPQDNTGSKRKSDGDADHSAAKIVKKVQSSGQKSRTYCTTCKRDCNTRDEYKVHMMSTAHAAQVAMAPSTSCMPEKAAPIIITTPQRHSGIIKKGKCTLNLCIGTVKPHKLHLNYKLKDHLKLPYINYVFSPVFNSSFFISFGRLL